jgi:hypothetical protein
MKTVPKSRLAAIVTAAGSLMIAGLSFGPLTAAAAVPNCVRTQLNDKGYTDRLTVTNTCKSLQRVKVVIANDTDKACRSFGPGFSYKYNWSYPGRFDKLVPC